ncbi:uncharacterized protein [Euwallacea similis]|uniref:uncharacterized protein isoform X1 n=1 Tax=Euwallacea similis TaxID=1736056 RepID=UPI00344DF6D9
MEADNIRNEKIQKVLKKFLDPNFKVKNDVYLNQFLTHLVGKNNCKSSDTTKALTNEQKDQFSQWLVDASSVWEKKKLIPPSTILSFTLNLASHLSKNEQIFVKLNSQNAYESLACITQTSFDTDASITHGFVAMLCSFLEHKSGLQWVLATNYWTEIFKLGLNAHTLYIQKKAYQFIAKLIKKTIIFNRQFCRNLVYLLVEPLKDALRILPASQEEEPAPIESSTLFETLKPSLIYISEVTEILIKDVQAAVLHLFEESELIEAVKKLLLLSQIEDFSCELIKIRFIMLFAKLSRDRAIKEGNVNQVLNDSLSYFDMKTLFDIIEGEMDKDHVKCVIRVCHFAHSLYRSIPGNAPLCVRKGEPIEFENQMVLFQILPLMLFFGNNGVSKETKLSDVFRREFVQKLVKLSAIRTLDICFRWKHRLMSKQALMEDMTFGLQYMLKAKNLLNKERATIFFQPLIYAMKDSIAVLETGECTCTNDVNPSCDNFLVTLLETIIDLVQTFDLTWKDSIETISVMSIACELLQYTFWSQKVTVSLLRLLNLALAKYMSPAMALLTYDSNDSVVSHTGNLLVARCHSTSWEIRDTALECVHTMAVDANIRFPAHKNVLLKAGLPQLLVQMALNDSEFYVRATAFKCLQELIQIDEIWEVIKVMDQFLDKILSIFENETEGIVRKEAVTLIHQINKFQHFPNCMQNRLYDVMTHGAVGDLHWEVKCNALDFWLNVIKVHLVNQGMIDDKFPEVTFSKEHRKIVTLNEIEVRKRLVKVLNQLSHNGCLYVLKATCLDDCDVEVSRKSATALVKLGEMLKFYHVPSENIDTAEPPSPPIQTSSSEKSMDRASSNSNSDPVPSPCSSIGNPEYPSFFDPLSPFRLPSSPSLNLDLLSPPTSNPSDNSESCIMDQETLGELPLSNVTENASINSDSKVQDVRNQLKNTSLSMMDPQKLDSIMDDLLKSNDISFLERIYSPADQVKNATAMQTKKYLAPSKFLKFIFDKVEDHVKEKTHWLDSLDEFDSLLDDILKEYNVVPDVNKMDCY